MDSALTNTYLQLQHIVNLFILRGLQWSLGMLALGARVEKCVPLPWQMLRPI